MSRDSAVPKALRKKVKGTGLVARSKKRVKSIKKIVKAGVKDLKKALSRKRKK